jgi:hypothetical protein
MDTTVRQAKQAHDAKLQAFHGYVYEQLNSPRREDILHQADQRIRLWRQNKLCSSYYIRFWSSVVKAGDSAFFKAKVLDACDQHAVAMRQHTPFSFLLKEYG